MLLSAYSDYFFVAGPLLVRTTGPGPAPDQDQQESDQHQTRPAKFFYPRTSARPDQQKFCCFYNAYYYYYNNVITFCTRKCTKIVFKPRIYADWVGSL